MNFAGGPSATQNYQYRWDGQIREISTVVGAAQQTFSYSYDNSGRMTSLTNPFNETFGWSYFTDDSIASQTSPNALANYSYDDVGRIKRVINSSATITRSDFKNIQYLPQGPPSSFELDMPVSFARSGISNFTYEGKEQLLTETKTGPNAFSRTQAYSPTGNITTFRSNSFTYNNKNQLTGPGGTSQFNYDSAGNPTKFAGTDLAWNAQDRLVRVGSVSAPIATYGYNPSGSRAWKKIGTDSKIYFVYIGDIPAFEIQNGNIIATNTAGNTGVLSRRSGAVTTNYQFSQTGALAHRLMASGGVFSSHSYEAYGWENPNSGVTNDPFNNFVARDGGYRDNETGFILMGARFYSVAQGRFLNRDPIGTLGGLNLHRYAANCPTLYNDPTGLSPAGNNGGDGSGDGSGGGALDPGANHLSPGNPLSWGNGNPLILGLEGPSASFWGEFGDNATFGLTTRFHDWTGGSSAVNANSPAYFAGSIASDIVQSLASSGTASGAKMGFAASNGETLAKYASRHQKAVEYTLKRLNRKNS